MEELGEVNVPVFTGKDGKRKAGSSLKGSKAKSGKYELEYEMEDEDVEAPSAVAAVASSSRSSRRSGR